MAKTTGGDVILTLMGEVSSLRDQQLEMTDMLEKLVSHSRAQGERMGRVAELIRAMADRLADHERRIEALESRRA